MTNIVALEKTDALLSTILCMWEFYHISGCKLSEFERVTALKVYNWFANRRKEMKRRANIGEDVITWISSNVFRFATPHRLFCYSGDPLLLRCWSLCHTFSLLFCLIPFFFFITTRSCHFGKPWHWGGKSKLPIQRRGGRDARVCRSGQSSVLRASKSTHLRLMVQYLVLVPYEYAGRVGGDKQYARY